MTVNVSPAPRGPKLDILATLRNSAGTVLATSNPTESLPATLTASITTPGTYDVSVDGVGKGDRWPPDTPTTAALNSTW